MLIRVFYSNLYDKSDKSIIYSTSPNVIRYLLLKIYMLGMQLIFVN